MRKLQILTSYSFGTSDGYRASLPNIRKYGLYFVVSCFFVLSANMVDWRTVSHRVGFSATSLFSDLKMQKSNTGFWYDKATPFFTKYITTDYLFRKESAHQFVIL